VLQAVLPALMLADGPSALLFEGGTHHPMAPPFDFLEKAFLPILNRMGPTVIAELERPGFYPAGGGRFHVAIQPVEKLQPIELLSRGEVTSKRARVMVAHLPPDIGDRQARMLRNKLNWRDDAIRIVSVKNSAGPGNVVLVEIESESVCEVFTSFGVRDLPSGKVVGSVIDDVREYLASDAPVGKHLADQLMIPFALAGGAGITRSARACTRGRTRTRSPGFWEGRSRSWNAPTAASPFSSACPLFPLYRRPAVEKRGVNRATASARSPAHKQVRRAS
jgi:RNA 3'-terminal phosphate cyclase (ATP)